MLLSHALENGVLTIAGTEGDEVIQLNLSECVVPACAWDVRREGESTAVQRSDCGGGSWF